MARMTPTDRKAAILEAAINVAQQKGFALFRLHHIAEAAECSNALVISHFSTMTQVKRAVMRAAIKREILSIIASGIVNAEPAAIKADPDLKRKALASLAG